MHNLPVAVLQKNGADTEVAVVWQLIQNFRPGDNFSLVYTKINEVSTSDQFGRPTPFMEASPGNAFKMVALPYLELRGNGAAHDPQAIEVTNALPQGVIDANIFKGGALLAVRQGLTPGQMASFVFSTSIFVGVVPPEITEGQIITGDTLSDINTEISLAGIASADVVLTGGGSGSDALSYRFVLENVVMG